MSSKDEFIFQFVFVLSRQESYFEFENRNPLNLLRVSNTEKWETNRTHMRLNRPT